MPPLIVLDLRIFASHCRTLLIEPPGGKGALSCLPGLNVFYRIETSTMESPIWDSIYIGYSKDQCNDHCGNRSGGIAAYAQIVQDYLHNLNAEIWNAYYEEQKAQTTPISNGF